MNAKTFLVMCAYVVCEDEDTQEQCEAFIEDATQCDIDTIQSYYDKASKVMHD